MTTTAKIHPAGFWEILASKLHWFWCPAEAEAKYDYFPEGFQTRIVEQDLKIILLPSEDKPSETLNFTLRAETQLSGTKAIMSADNFLAFSRSTFLRDAGKSGIEIPAEDGKEAFLPHSRIDKIIPGQVRVVRAGSRNT